MPGEANSQNQDTLPAKKGNSSGDAKRDDIEKLLGLLRGDLESAKLTPEQRHSALEKVKIYGRDPEDAGAIFTTDGIEVLTKHGFDGTSLPDSLEALRCLANALLLEPKTQQIFVDLDYSGQAAERLKLPDSDTEFLISRILFLTTYNSNLDFDPLFDKHSLGESINAHVARHTEQYTKKSPPAAIDRAALSESLKLLFNISNYYPHRIATFTPTIENIFSILNNVSIPHPPLQSPINSLINALVNLDLTDPDRQHSSHHPPTPLSPDYSTSTFPKLNPNTNIDKLISILDQSVSAYKPSQLETLAVPLLTLLRKIYEFAPSGPKRYMQWLLLPEADDRDLPLGQSDSLSSRLLRLSTAPTAPSLREAISSLLFECSDKEPSSFVRNIGYGYAAGFLFSHGIPVPESATAAFPSATGRKNGKQGKHSPLGPKMGQEDEEDMEEELINPVTGQKLRKERQTTLSEPMSEEEKEREAEKLFVLLERLRRISVLDVRDPIREAVERGEFQGVDGGGAGGGRVEEVEE